MEKKFTKGEWSVNLWRSTNEYGVTYKGRENGVDVFEAPGVEERHYQIYSKIDPMKHCIQADFQGAHIARIVDFVHQDGGVESLANAKLMSAAPILLQALEAARDTLILTSCIDKSNLSKDTLEVVESAIKKALE
jgi:hypothetical protein